MVCNLSFFKIGVYFLLIMPPHSYLKDFNLVWHTCSKNFSKMYALTFGYIFLTSISFKFALLSTLNLFICNFFHSTGSESKLLLQLFNNLFGIFRALEGISFLLKKISERNFSISTKSFKIRLFLTQ